MASTSDVVGVIITLKGSGLDDCKDEHNQPYDFVSRYFAPWLGVSEDPVTGKMTLLALQGNLKIIIIINYVLTFFATGVFCLTLNLLLPIF